MMNTDDRLSPLLKIKAVIRKNNMEEQSFSGRINKKGGVGMETICSLISDNTVYQILIKTMKELL